MKHHIQKTSFRALAREFWLDHAWLAKFYRFARESWCLHDFFHVFLECRSCLYIADKKEISYDDLDHSEEIILLTKRMFETMM